MFWIENYEAESNTEKKTEEDDDAFKEKEDKFKKKYLKDTNNTFFVIP